jgi:phospholipase/carboxylesterase
MSLQTFEVNPASAPRATIVILHGLGADGTDFLSFADELKLDAVGPLRYVFPRAPTRAVTINGGHQMRAWYDILNMDLVRREDETGLRQSFAQVHALLDAEVARGVPASRIVLGGFSQGCAVTLGAGLRYGSRLAGLIGMSGYLPIADKLEAERSAANRDTPVFQAHGQRDGVIDIGRAKATRDQLLAQGQPLEWHDYPMEHSVCMEEVQAMQAWLRRVLAA